MAGIHTTAQLTQLVNTIRAKAIMTMQAKTVFPGVVDRVDVPDGNRSYTEPKIGGLTAYALTDGVDMAQAQQLVDSLITVTPSEIGVQAIFTKLMAKTRTENIASLLTKAITDALKKKQDQDGIAMMDGFSKYQGTGSGTTLTRAFIANARAYITGNATEPFESAEPRCVVHPYSYNDLITLYADLKVTTSGAGNNGVAGLPEEFARKYVVGELAGMPIMTSANIPISSNAAKGAVFVKEAVVYAELWGIDIEEEKNASLRGTEINGTMCYAYGERHDHGGVELNVGATEPVS